MKTLRPYQQKAVNECWRELIKSDEPVLLMASVGAGKSLMIADILLRMQHAGKRVLCLVNNAELVRNNCETFINQGGKSSIYCASLGAKDCSAPVVFGTPISVLNAINKNTKLSNIPFNMIVVDEAHAINYESHKTAFMRILRHFKHLYPDMRLLGATGTNFRFKGHSIVGPNCLFKTQVGNITTDKLINDGYLVRPEFSIDEKLVLDFSHIKVKPTGVFDQLELEAVVEKSARLTELICDQVIHIMETQQRRGVFFFASTKKHAQEILSHLPKDESALILGETPQDQRTEILDKARTGVIKYLVNIAIISVGVDVPAYDTIAYLRPTESLVLLVQTMGRVLRLSPSTNKTDALVLDFAGNIDRHRDWDNPILVQAVNQTIDKDKPLVIMCPCCQQMNTEHARRCVGRPDDKRCDYFFEFKDCVNSECLVKNDISARNCRVCNEELIDPNAKLNLEKIYNPIHEGDVLKSKYTLIGTSRGFRLKCTYRIRTLDGIKDIQEWFTPNSVKSMNIFYGQFVRKHCKESSKYYMHLKNIEKVREMLEDCRSPGKIHFQEESGEIKIKKKFFN